MKLHPAAARVRTRSAARWRRVLLAFVSIATGAGLTLVALPSAAAAAPLAPMATFATGAPGTSEGPTPYTVDAAGITLPEGTTFMDGDHVNIQTSQGDRGIHFEALNWPDDHPKKFFIGKSFIPWSAFGLTDPFCVSWVQLSKYNEHYGEGGQPPVCVGEEEPPTENPPPATPDPRVDATDWQDGEKPCGATSFTQTRTVTTVPYIVVEQEDGTWKTMEDTAKITVTPESRIMPIPAEEVVACPPAEEPPTEKPPVVTPPVVTPPVELPPTVVTPKPVTQPTPSPRPTELAATGARSDSLPWLAAIGALLLAAGTAFVIRQKMAKQ